MSSLSAAVLAAGLSVLVLAGCSTPTADGGPDASPRRAPAPEAAPAGFPAGEWVRLPDRPLTPREAPAAAHVPADKGDLVVFAGGYVGPPCPATMDCAHTPDSTASDGAAFDLETGTWQLISDAPRPVAAYASTAVVDDTLYVLTDDHVLAWDAQQDAWSELEPPTRPHGVNLVADTQGGAPRLILASGSDESGYHPDQVYDPVHGTWSRLPADPLRPSFDRLLVSTPHGLVLTAKPLRRDGGPEDPALVRAAVLPPGAATWRSLPHRGDQLGGWSWSWTGRRLVDPTPGGSDGGVVGNYGRTLPYGGALDPATGGWDPLEHAPREHTGGWAVEALGGRRSAVQGWLYDDGVSGRGSSWTRLPRPEGAPAEPGRGVWAGDVLVVSGGADWDDPPGPDGWRPQDVWSSGTWAYRA